MILTEEEARTKWCPFFRAAIGVGPSDGVEIVSNRMRERGNGACTCIGSDCMAWRWSEFPYSEEGGSKIRRYGFCGLAGRIGSYG